MQENDQENYQQIFHPATTAWFETAFPSATPVQLQGWPAIAAGKHVLISAPTGTGKTLTAFLVFIDRLQQRARHGERKNGVSLLYISPLKALGNDIRENLKRPLEGIDGPELSVAVRTGDTPQKDRQLMAKRSPDILITTPESLYLLLTSRTGRRILSTAEAIIIDELHALINSKRGAHLMLSLARLDALCEKPLQRIGLSATVEPLAEAAKYLASPDEATIIAPKMQKLIDIAVVNPVEDMRALPEGTIWPEIAKAVLAHCEGARTVIAFVEGRGQAEKLAQVVNELVGDGFARTHHGSVSKEQRLEAEELLRKGTLRLLCATSSMELGIDVGEVDLVLQIGYPRTISSAMQRLGRAGHNPGRTSMMRFFPRMALESVNCGLTAKLALMGGIERVKPPRECLDVLAQHLVSLAVDDRYSVNDAMKILKRAYPFQNVSEKTLCDVLKMLSGDYEHLRDRPARPRIIYDRIHQTVAGDTYSRLLALSAGGTIPDRGLFAVRLSDGTKLGELDEEFVFEARVGQKFLLGAFAWKIQEIGRDSVIVGPTTPDNAGSPFWRGDGVGRAYRTGLQFGALLRELNEAYHTKTLNEALMRLTLDQNAADNAEEVLNRQIKATGCLADDRTIIVEHFTDQSGAQIMVHSVFGGQVNAGLALLMKETVRKEAGINASCFDEDDGFLLLPYGEDQPMPDGVLQRIDPKRARGILTALLPSTPLFSMAFRYNMARALLMGTRNGKRQPLWVQRLRGAQALDEVVMEKDHPIMTETCRECLEDYWDLNAIEKVLTDIGTGAVAVREIHLAEPSPMSLPFRRQVEMQMVYDYYPTPSRAFVAVEAALAEEEAQLTPAKEQLEKVAERTRQPQNAEQLHALLMAEGDIVAGEVDAPAEWLTDLSRQDRALYIEPGLWICAEQAELYRLALMENDEPSRLRLVRRCLRYRGPQNAATLSDRYFWPEELCEKLLSNVVDSGAAVLDGEWVYHAELYQRARQRTITARREQVETQPPERFAALLAAKINCPGSALEQLRNGLSFLLDQPYPPSLWESVLLPARTSAYRPALLDELLAEGEFFWRMNPGGRMPDDRVSAEPLSAERPSAKQLSAKRLSVKRLSAEKLSNIQLPSESLSANRPLPEHPSIERPSAGRLPAERVSPERVSPERPSAERSTLSFHRQSDIDWDQSPPAVGAELSQDEEKVVQALSRRGASFAQSLSGVLEGKPVLPVLLSLTEKGLARSDSFFPIRQNAGEMSVGSYGGGRSGSTGSYGGAGRADLTGSYENTTRFGQTGSTGGAGNSSSPKKRARLRALGAGSTGGRWELTRGLAATPLEQAILQAFDRYTILCRETVSGFSWPEALSVLRIWEYTGKVRRGYFVRGLSGAQFIRDDAYRAVMLALKSPREDIVWLSAADPYQCWGRVLPHMEGRSFTCIKSTAVALSKGVPVMVFEKNGQVLRLFEDSLAKDALFAFAAAFQQGRVFYGRTRVVVKLYPKEAEQAMIAAGFMRQMLDYELFRRGSV